MKKPPAKKPAKPKVVKTKTARAIIPSKVVWLEICDRIAAGESLRKIVDSNVARFPSPQSFLRWVEAAIDAEESHALYGLPEHYARSQMARAATHGDQVLDIADNPWTPEWSKKIEDAMKSDGPKAASVYIRGMLQHAQIRIDARKWHSARMDPKRWHLNSDSGKSTTVTEEETVQIVGGLPDGE